ncbi:sensor histidine kinase [Streptomyces zagrosensis]|uniref:histidine kinase n=1 Tax=Streptomyces zagrosensis TaxID=1042984 RepID=A0A7W9V0N4_9ACTN|nr:nitrate- and nitrite sensing domain-containing protein [Streptomyces zagrosensis]MBB5936944.1 signal transduction histidine kinase [Streptomyces zagrosensis]
MRKRRLRGSKGERGEQTAVPVRRAHARSRLVVSAIVIVAAVLAAGAPVIVAAVDDVKEAQRCVDRAEAAMTAVALAHSLSDERDAMTAYVATGRSTASGAGVSEDVRSRVDRQIVDLRSSASDASVTFAGATKRLGELSRVRQRALAGPGSAAETFDAYTSAVQALHRAAGGTDPETLGPLGRVVEQASASRALLLGALASRGRQPGLAAAAQRTNVREQAAVADFEQTAPRGARERYARTVNDTEDTEVTAAKRYLAQLTDGPRLSSADLALDRERVGSALFARVNRMRDVETALTTEELTRAEKARDDEVTALELRAAVLAGCLLLAIAVSVHAARSLTRPLTALRVGALKLADDPAGAEPVVLGRRDAARGDEFCDVVRSVNQLYEGVGSQRARVAKLAAERGHLIEERQRLAAQIAEVRQECEELRQRKDEIETRLNGLRERVHSSFVNLALRTLGLVERQLTVIETMEENEQDPERLDTLFALDHLATGIRRYSENLLVIAGSERQSNHPGSVPLLDVLRAAISEVERYQRIRIQPLPPHAQVAGFAADSVSHLIAELLENATVFSPPGTEVHVSGWLLESGEVMLSVQDEGIGMTADRLDELNTRLADPVPEYCQGPQPEDPLGLGLYVVTRLAARHGVRVQLREQKQGGVTAVVVLPKPILPDRLLATGEAQPLALSSDSGWPGGDGLALPGPRSDSGPEIEVDSRAAPVYAHDGPADPSGQHHRYVRDSADDANDPHGAANLDGLNPPRGSHDHGPHAAPAGARSPVAPMVPHASADSGPAQEPDPAAPDPAAPSPGAPHTAAPHTAAPRLPATSYADTAHTPAAPDVHTGTAPYASADPDAHGPSRAAGPHGATDTGSGRTMRGPGVVPAPGAAPVADDAATESAQLSGGRREQRGGPASPGGREHPGHRGPVTAEPTSWQGEPWDDGPEADEPHRYGPPRVNEPRSAEPGRAGTPAANLAPEQSEADSPPGLRTAGPFEEPPVAASPDEPWAAGLRRGRARGVGDRPLAPDRPSAPDEPEVVSEPNGAGGAPRAGSVPGPQRDPLVVAAERTIQLSLLQAPGALEATTTQPGAPQPSAPQTGAAQSPARAPRAANLPVSGLAGPDESPDIGPRTDKGLPKRSPRVVAPRKAVAGERRKVDAEAVRRRLGGFQQGAQQGRRDAEAEIAEQIVTQRSPLAADGKALDREAQDREQQDRRPSQPPQQRRDHPPAACQHEQPRREQAQTAGDLGQPSGDQPPQRRRQDAPSPGQLPSNPQQDQPPHRSQIERSPYDTPQSDASPHNASPHDAPPYDTSDTSDTPPSGTPLCGQPPHGQERPYRSTYEQEQHHQPSSDQGRYDQPPHGREQDDRPSKQRHTHHQAGALDAGGTVEEARS